MNKPTRRHVAVGLTSATAGAIGGLIGAKVAEAVTNVAHQGTFVLSTNQVVEGCTTASAVSTGGPSVGGNASTVNYASPSGTTCSSSVVPVPANMLHAEGTLYMNGMPCNSATGTNTSTSYLAVTPTYFCGDPSGVQAWTSIGRSAWFKNQNCRPSDNCVYGYKFGSFVNSGTHSQ